MASGRADTHPPDGGSLTAALTATPGIGRFDLLAPVMRAPESSRGMTTHDIPNNPVHPTIASQRLTSLGYRSDVRPDSTRLPTATRLWLDWDVVARSRSNIRRANDWGLSGAPIQHLDDVLTRSGYGQSLTDDACDHYLSRLTALARHDELACRIVIQRILPGLIAIAVRRGRIVPEGASFALDQLVSCAWLVIRNYPIDRRPCRVAGNLLRDIEYQAFVRDNRTKRSRSEVPTDNWTLANPESIAARRGRPLAGVSAPITDLDPVSTNSEISNLLHDLERLGLRDIDREALDELLSDRLSPDSARLAGISARALRDRRAAAIKRSRELLGITP